MASPEREPRGRKQTRGIRQRQKLGVAWEDTRHEKEANPHAIARRNGSTLRYRIPRYPEIDQKRAVDMNRRQKSFFV